MNSRSLIQRGAVIVGLLLLSVYLFYIGKGHTLLLDTNAVTIDGKEYKVPDAIEVTVSGQKEEMGRAERAMITVIGPNHSIMIEDASGCDKKIMKEFSIPTFMDTAVVSIPAILGETSASHWLLPFFYLSGEEEQDEISEVFHQDEADVVALPADASAGTDKPVETKP